jgi:regulator of protease activity HflC (stomatin/prohibitin superfamily)
MKRAEQIAWSAVAGLIAIAAILVTGGFLYQFTAFWAGAMLAGCQALVVGLIAWGLMLARQAAELNQVPTISPRPSSSGAPAAMSGFRMSVGDDASNPIASPRVESEEFKTLDTGFQRMVVLIAGVLFTGCAILSSFLIYRVYAWANANPGEPIPIGGTLKEPLFAIDEKGVLIGLSAALIYGVLYWISRPRRDPGGYGEATSSNFTLGITAMAALAVATALGYLRVAYASELATGVIAFFLFLQGLELIVNALRNYSSIEEFDQEAVDLQATPLTPMIGSVWLYGLRMLFAQSMGISSRERRERGVTARLMPRVIVATILIAIGVSCIRVVQPGQVAVLERLGYAATDPKGHLLPQAILKPGMHLTLPWPMDKLVYIPTEQLQLTNVGTELHTPKEWKGIDFQFWMVRDDSNENADVEDLFLTGDKSTSGDESAPQILETYVQVRWRVTKPEQFYSTISHSEFYDKSSATTKTLPIYEAIVQQCTSFAVTRAFAIHTLEQVMIGDRREVEEHCRDILQQKLDSLGQAIGLTDSGIQVEHLTIKDLHPPYFRPDRYDPSEPRVGGDITFTDKGIEIRENQRSRMKRGPASAFEFANSMREFQQQLISLANADAAVQIKGAEMFAEGEKRRAEADRLDKVARAHGDADRLVKMTENMDPQEQKYQLGLMEQQLLYRTLKDLVESPGRTFDQINKFIVDPAVKDVEVYQSTDKGLVPAPAVRPPN